MADVFSTTKRSEVMSRIRGKNNKDTEIALIRAFHAHQITGWRRNQKVFGNPDFVFRKKKLAIFVDGCFWHACPVHFKMPETNRSFWETKFAANKARDELVSSTLTKKGWRVCRIWEHELKPKTIGQCIGKIRNLLEKD